MFPLLTVIRNGTNVILNMGRLIQVLCFLSLQDGSEKANYLPKVNEKLVSEVYSSHHVLQLYVGLITSEVNGSSFIDFSQC